MSGLAAPAPGPARAARNQTEVVDRLLGLGARHLDIGQGDVPWVVLADPEGNPFCVLEERPLLAGSGLLGALPLDSADPDRDAAFWSWLTGWTDVDGYAARSLRHPSGFSDRCSKPCPEPRAKGPGKNRLHLDVRLDDPDDPDEVAAGYRRARGPRAGQSVLAPGLPWRLYADPSGNVLGVLPGRW